ncbi:MAG: hypothetical protein ACHP93_05540, partial [Solirubrobacterales bacterium]
CLGRLRDLKRVTEGEPANSQEWSRLMRMLAADAEVAFWNARIEWLQSARELLEQLPDEPDRANVAGTATGAGAQIGRLRAL